MSTDGRTDVTEEALPKQIPIGRAARAPIGRGSVTTIAKVTDSIAVVLAPLLVPACVLALIRSGHNFGDESDFTLVDVAFGVVAVAFAALARSLTGKGQNWKIVGAIGVLVMIFETGLAVVGDDTTAMEELASNASHCAPSCDLGQIHSLADGIIEGAPSSLQWVVALMSGALLCATALYAIWSES